MRLVRAFPGFLALALFGCQSNEPAHAPMQLAAGSTAEPEQAASKLATARCLAAERCVEFSVDTSSDLQDFPHCMSIMRKLARSDLDACPSGVDANRVHTCADSWAKLQCSGVPITQHGGISVLPECRAGVLCRG
jgi:hypothetical protein